MGLLSWLILGLVAGLLAGQVMQGGGYGIIGDIVVGVIGAFVGGYLFSLVTGNPNPVNHLDIGSILVAFVGACLLIGMLRAIPRSRMA